MRVSEDPTPSEAKRGGPDEPDRLQEARAALSAPLTPAGIRGGEPLHYAPPDADVYGTVAIETFLEDLDFPQSKGQLLERCGEWRFPVEPGRNIAFGDLLKELPDREFANPHAVARAAAPIVPKFRKFNDTMANLPKTEFFRPHGLP